MHLTTPRRGLALSAVAALTLTGLGAAPAVAEEAAAPVDGITLLTPFNDARAVTVRPVEGFGFKPVRLVAEVAEPGATVTFDYNPDPQAADDAEGWERIGESAVADGFASVSWTPVVELEGRQVALRAVASTTVGDLTTSVTDALGGVTVAPSGRNGTPPTLDSVDLLGSQAPYFPQPYADSNRTAELVTVDGVTSAEDGTVAVSWWRSADGSFTGTTDASVEQTPFKTFGFRAALDISGSALGAGDTIAVGAERGTDEVATYVLAEQRIGSISASTNDPVRAGETAQVRLRVGATSTDQAVAGAEVRRLSDGVVVGYTDVDGVVTTTQVGGTPETYYANATDDDGYSADAGDATTDAFDPSYVPEPRSVDGYLGDGPVFDRDELAPGDVGVLVRDQQGEPLEGAEVEYRLHPSGETPPETWESATTEEDGVAPVSPGSEDADGTYTLDYRLPAPEQDPEDPPLEPEFSSTEFTVGQAALTLDPGAGTVRADSGGTIEYSGRLAVGEAGLSDRLIDLEYLRGLEFVPGRAADAGIETDEGLTLTQSITTDEDGRFTVLITDPAEAGSPTESGGSLLVATGDTVATEGSTVTGNADEEVSSGTEFGRGRGSATLRRGASGNGAGADVVKARGPASVAGETVRVLRVTADGGRRVVATRTLDADGDAQARVPDANGTRFTTYVVKLVPSRRVTGSEAPPIRVM